MKFIKILVTEGRKEDLRKKYSGKLTEEELDWILNISDLVDFNHKYTDFVMKTTHDRVDLDMYVEIAIQLVKDFDKYQSQLEKKDINQYNSLEELDTALFPFREKEKQKEAEKQVEKVYENDKFLVIKPKSHAASCKYGSNTKWCTTSQDDQHFKRYTSGGQELYYIINKQNSKNQNYSKIAIHFDDGGSMRYYDSKDTLMSDREIEVVNYAFPEIIEPIKQDFEKNRESAQELYLKQIFNKKGVSNKTKEKFLGTDYKLNVSVEGFETINDLGPGHAHASVDITLNQKLIDSYQVFITYRPKENKFFSYSIGFMGNDSQNEDNFIDLDLEGWGFDGISSFKNSDAQYISDSLRNHIANRVMDYIKEKPQLQQKIIGSSRVWTPSLGYGYTFGKNKGMIKKLVDYLDSGEVGTKLDFLEKIGNVVSQIKNGKKLYNVRGGEPYRPKTDMRGQFSSFFASAKLAGILDYRKEGKDYFLIKGPNFDAFKKGELKAL